MVDTSKLNIAERYAYELGRKKAATDIGSLLIINATGKNAQNINQNDLAILISVKRSLEVVKQYLMENNIELKKINEEAEKIVKDAKDVKKNQ